MSDLEKYIERRKKSDSEFRADFEDGYEHFKIGLVLKQAREAAGLTQDQVATAIGTKKTAISRLENHAEDVRLSTLERYVKAVGKELKIRIA